MGSAPQAPKAPDPSKTAQTQSQYNLLTAMQQQFMNMTNQNTPYGSLTYNQTGTQVIKGPDGKTYKVPTFTATTTLTPEQQKLFGINNETMTNFATLGRDQSARLGQILSAPIDFSNEAVEGRLMDLGMKRLNPQFAETEEALRTRLANQGLRPGSAAWDAEMRRMGENKNDAVNELLLKGRAQSVQEILAQRNQPINEITALMTGSQVRNPTFGNTPQTGVGGTDYTGAVGMNQNAQWQQYQAQMAQRNAMMGGLFGLGGAGIRAFAGGF